MPSRTDAPDDLGDATYRRTGWFGKLLVFLGYLSLIPAVGWWVAFKYLGDSHWAMFVVNSVAPYLFLPVPIVLLASLRWRRWGLFTASLVPVAVFFILFGQALLPRSVKVDPVPATAPTLTLMTFNLHADNENFGAVADSIVSSGADVVALQELAPAMIAELRTRLADSYPHYDVVVDDGWEGLGVFSKLPLTPLPTRIQGLGPRNPQMTRIHMPEADVTLINVHNLSIPRSLPSWPSEITYSVRQRERVSNGIHDFAVQRDGPLIAAGDFNTTPRSIAYERITEVLDDSWLEAGFGFGQTFPGGPLKPTPLGITVPNWLLRIDYVFHSDEWETANASIGPWDGNSDHRPVIVDLALVGNEN